jgi:hypothetical protein
MPVDVTKMDDEPIFIITITDPYDSVNDSRRANEEIAEAITHFDGPFYRINDIRQISLSFGDVVMGMAEERQKLPGSASDPRCAQSVLVGGGMLVSLVASASKQDQYGVMPVRAFTDFETALEWVREDLKANL